MEWAHYWGGKALEQQYALYSIFCIKKTLYPPNCPLCSAAAKDKAFVHSLQREQEGL